MNHLNNMEENFNDSHEKTHMDPMEDANKTERLDEQSGKISNAFNDMKGDISGREEKKKCGREKDEEQMDERRESDARNKEM